MDAATLPEILEIKTTLDGARKEFHCRRLLLEPARVVVLFVSGRPYHIDDLHLPVGTVTFGHFWADRPYNAYHWMSPEGLTLAYYFNVSDHTTLGPEQLTWRDLTVDILVRPGEAPRILDVDELPPQLDHATRGHIDAACAELLRGADALAAGLEHEAGALWPRAFGRQRP